MTRQEVMDFLLERERQPFVWGETDCVQLCASLLEQVRGTRPALPTYASEIEAKRVLVERGGLKAAVEAALGPMNRHRPDCSDGDIVLTAFQGVHGLGIAVPPFFWLCREGGGFVPLELTLAIGFWPCRSS